MSPMLKEFNNRKTRSFLHAREYKNGYATFNIHHVRPLTWFYCVSFSKRMNEMHAWRARNCSLSFLNASHVDCNKLLQWSSIGLLEVTASETAISIVSITAFHWSIDRNCKWYYTRRLNIHHTVSIHCGSQWKDTLLPSFLTCSSGTTTMPFSGASLPVE